jgi:kumamolisin
MNMATHSWSAPKKANFVGVHEDTAPIDVTLVLRRVNPIQAAALGGHAALAHADFHINRGAHPDVLTNAFAFINEHGLTVTHVAANRHVIKVQGTPEALKKAFAVELHRYESHDGKRHFTSTDKEPTLPQDVTAVLGLDRRPVAHPYIQYKKVSQHAPDALEPGDSDNTYTPLQLGEAYGFPAHLDGTGEYVGIIELGGGYTDDNLQQYFQSIGVKAPFVESIGVAGGSNSTGTDADGEVQLDIEVAGALAPGAKFAVYFTTNTDEGFAEAISQAAHDSVRKISVISISWGGPENGWTPQAIQGVQQALEDAVALGITVTVAAGDNGAADGEQSGLNADFPASSPSVLACGGTKLIAQGVHISQESVWNEDANGEGATGGGVSQVFAKPAWQSAVNVPVAPGNFTGRGLPDVAGDADPVTGYQVRVNGEDQVVGGTSAVAPLWAALAARFNQGLKHNVGALGQIVYSLPKSAFHDIVAGTNDGYSAAVGWDPCTGFGSPNGAALLTALEALK